MKFKQPCKNCPFLKNNSTEWVTPERANEFLYAITHDVIFPCHRTVNYSKETPNTNDAIACFGSALFLENTVRGGCRSNVAYRIAIAKKDFLGSDLRKDENVYESFKAFAEGVSHEP